ncbi:MAG: low temperature requirement protein A [Amaricoccus sp.]|uniref:low temperature requirement protein A n=1 Tax=Amaricoccus sp. TaxID=1872485 RepID=UPI0039E64F75
MTGRQAALVRDRGAAGAGRVAFVELFYDLVFVFAITQLSHLLLHHYTLLGAVETAVLLLAVWWVWIFTTWALNWLDPEAIPVRVMLYASMLLGLFMSMAIPEAFGERGLVFALAFAGMQVGRSLFTMVILRRAAPENARNFQRISIWLAVSGVVWIIGGLAAPEVRLPIWLIALAIEYLGPVFAFWTPGLGRSTTDEWRVLGGHIAERCGLFVIICLGETLLVSGATFAEAEWTGTGLAAFLADFVSSVAMWWVYFNVGHERAAHLIEHHDDPGRVARLAFTYAHIPIIAGIVLSAVASELIIAEPAHHVTAGQAAAIIGGPALFLAGNAWFKTVTGRWTPLSHLVGLGLLAALAVMSTALTLLGQGLLAAVVMVVVAAWEAISLRPSRAEA